MAGNRMSGRHKDPHKDERREKVADMWEKAYSAEEISEATGYTRGTVQSIICDMGLTDRNVSKTWMQQSGIGKKWDAACRRIRKLCTK